VQIDDQVCGVSFAEGWNWKGHTGDQFCGVEGTGYSKCMSSARAKYEDDRSIQAQIELMQTEACALKAYPRSVSWSQKIETR